MYDCIHLKLYILNIILCLFYTFLYVPTKMHWNIMDAHTESKTVKLIAEKEKKTK